MATVGSEVVWSLLASMMGLTSTGFAAEVVKEGVDALLRALTPDEYTAFKRYIKKLIKRSVNDADMVIKEHDISGIRQKWAVKALLFQKFKAHYCANQTCPTPAELVTAFDDPDLTGTLNDWRRPDNAVVLVIQKKLEEWLAECSRYVNDLTTQQTLRTALEMFDLLTHYIEPEDSAKEHNCWPKAGEHETLHFAREDRVKFWGRETDMVRLENFCEKDQRPLCWWMVAGDGGTGKSRLCLELAKKMKEQDWTICYPRDKSFEGLRDCSRTLTGNTLFIFDYAETDATAIWRWLPTLVGDVYNTIKIRVILIQRKGETLEMLSSDREIQENNYQSPLLIEELEAGTFEEPGPLREILRDFIEKNGKNHHKANEQQFEEAILNNLAEIDKATKYKPSKNRPLFLQIVAEVFLEDPDSLQVRNLKTVLDFTFKKEKRMIEKYIKGLCAPNIPTQAIYKIGTRIVACATFVNGITVYKRGGRSDFEALLPEDYSDLPGKCGTIVSVQEFLSNKNLFDVSENESVCPPLEPDIIGEYFVLKCLHEMKDNSPDAVSHLLDAVWDNRSKEAVAFINRVRQDHPDDYADLFDWQQDKKWEAAAAAGMSNEIGIDKETRTLTFANMPWRFLDFKPAAGQDPAKALLLSENIIGLHAYDEQGVFDYDEYADLPDKVVDKKTQEVYSKALYEDDNEVVKSITDTLDSDSKSGENKRPVEMTSKKKCSTNWEKCSLQKLLNLKDGAFWQSRIPDDSWERIATTPNITLSKVEDEVMVGTPDMMFLLDTEQTARYFASSESSMARLVMNQNDIVETASRIKEKNLPGQTIEYVTALVQSWDNSDIEQPAGARWWWLRSPGFDARYAALVSVDGFVLPDGTFVLDALGGVRPALWLNLKS
jgi:hypothetical protein